MRNATYFLRNGKRYAVICLAELEDLVVRSRFLGFELGPHQ